MGKERAQFCFNCGASLGTYEAYYRDVQNCGAPECLRAEREDREAEREEAHRRIEDEFNDGAW